MPRIDATIKLKGKKADVLEELRRLPGYVSGRLPDTKGIGKVFKIAFGQALLEKIHTAFIAKSQLVADDLNQRWPDITPETKAQRPLLPGDIGKLGIGGRGNKAHNKRVRGLLTIEQDKVWRGIFWSVFNRLRQNMDERRAKAEAAKRAWAYVKKALGAQTKIATLGQRKLLVNRVDDRLLNSLAPGTLNGSYYNKPADQHFETKLGTIEIGSKLKYARHVHKKRPLWPKSYTMRPWFRYAAVRARDHLVDQLTRNA